MIVINVNQEEEMMNITKDKKSIFYGNFCDFDRSPEGLRNFLIEIGVNPKEIILKNDLPPIG